VNEIVKSAARPPRGKKRRIICCVVCGACRFADGHRPCAKKKIKEKKPALACGMGACATMWSFIFPMGTERDDFSAAQLAFKFGARRRLNYTM